MRIRSVLSIGLVALVLSGCTTPSHQSSTERYISPIISGEAQRINLDQVEKAFFNTRAKDNDLTAWMSAFEKRVNEIYEGSDIVSVDASRDSGKLKVTGFVEKNKQPGFQNDDDRLFSLEQTGDVVNNQMPYKIADQNGNAYHHGHYSLFDNPFIQAMVIGNLLSGFGPRYYTPYAHTTILRDHRDSFRKTPSFSSQKAANQQFNTRFKERAAGGGIGSNSRFNRRYGTGSGATRSWSGSERTSPQMSPWGGRRSSPFGGMRRGWGGRRR